MRTFATRKSTKDSTCPKQQQKRSGVPLSIRMPLLQPKPSCPCGGGCPRCQSQARLRTKLKISEPGDKYEREADRLAEEVMRMPAPRLQRQSEPKEEETLQTKTSSEGTPTVSSNLQNQITALRGRGQPLPQSERAFFEPRFGADLSQVRIHTDSQAAKTAGTVNARAFTLGRDIVFGSGQYQPSQFGGRRLLAHELTHYIQQNEAEGTAKTSQTLLTTEENYLQRDIAEEKLATTPVEQIISDESYFENGIQSIEFYSAELAILNYNDGSQIRLGLVPDQIEAPFEAVDYRTPRSSHLPISPTASSLGRGSILFLPRGRHAEFPAGTTAGDIPRLAQQVGRTIRFTHHANGRIVPTEVNTLSAPRLSAALREAEAEFIRRFDAMSEGAIEVLEKLEWVILLASIAGGLIAAGARAAAGRAATAIILGRAQSRLVQFFSRLLGTGASEAITVEGVTFGGVRVASRGTELLVRRSAILNVSRIPGRGRLINGAFEQAAIQTARQAGARTARVAIDTVVNPKWAAYLESQGYTFEVLTTKTGFTKILTKVFTL